MKRDVGAKFCTDFGLSHKNAIFHLLASPGPGSCLVAPTTCDTVLAVCEGDVIGRDLQCCQLTHVTS